MGVGGEGEMVHKGKYSWKRERKGREEETYRVERNKQIERRQEKERETKKMLIKEEEFERGQGKRYCEEEGSTFVEQSTLFI